jgi:hypothetical protein
LKMDFHKGRVNGVFLDQVDHERKAKEMMNRGIKGAGNSIFIAAWILFGILLGAAPSTAQGTKDLLAYWTFDQTVGAWVADTMGEATGSLKGNMEWLDGADARFGKALRFDGSDGVDSGYVALPLGGALANPDTNAISFSVWLRSDEDIPTMSVSYRSVFNSSSGQDYYIMYYDKGAQQLRFKVSNTEGGAARPGINASDIPKGAWYHVAAGYDGATAALYLNGTLKGSLALTGNVPNGQVSAIGCKGNSASQYWKGDMDDLAIWKRALTGPEIALLAGGSASLIDSASAHPEILTGLLAHWDFDESIGAPVAEYRGLANGTLSGDAIVLSGSDALFGDALRLNESGGADSGFVALPREANWPTPTPMRCPFRSGCALRTRSPRWRFPIGACSIARLGKIITSCIAIGRMLNCDSSLPMIWGKRPIPPSTPPKFPWGSGTTSRGSTME